MCVYMYMNTQFNLLILDDDNLVSSQDYSRYDVRDDELLVTHQVYFDVTFGGYPSARVVIGLFGDVVPKTVANFIALAKGQQVYVEEIGEYRFYGYNGSIDAMQFKWKSQINENCIICKNTR